MNINKQIEYWKSGSVNDIDTAELLIKNNKLLNGLFFCHLVLEKIIKAHVVLATKNVPPKSHDLLYLLKKTELILESGDTEFLGLMMKYQLEGRYPEYYPMPPSREKSNEYLSRTKDLLKCLKKKL